MGAEADSPAGPAGMWGRGGMLPAWPCFPRAGSQIPSLSASKDLGTLMTDNFTLPQMIRAFVNSISMGSWVAFGSAVSRTASS